MDREKFESILLELHDSEVEHSRKTELFQELRNGTSNLFQERDEFKESGEKLQRDNSDLVISNSKLFRQAGIVGEQEQEQEEEQEYSETITLEQIEGAN